MHLTDNSAPYEMLKHFDIGADEEDELNITEVAGDDGEWITVTPFFPDATLLVVLWQKGVCKIGVRYEDKVSHFDVHNLLLRDGSPIEVEK
jgi:hypothetical protein